MSMRHAPKQYSIAQARDSLASIVHDVERGEPVELTRRGKPVAVVMSLDHYRRATAHTPGFLEAWEAFRQTTDLGELAFSPDELGQMRDQSPGRDFQRNAQGLAQWARYRHSSTDR